MNATRAITLRLDPTDYDRLEAEAERLGLPPATLARVYVRAGLTGDGLTQEERNRNAGLAALEGLAALRKRLPDTGTAVDAVRIVQEGREELDRRMEL